MNKFLRTALCLALTVFACARAFAAKPFYDSKSWIVNVAGDYQFLQTIGFESKVNGLNVNIPVNPANISEDTWEQFAKDLTNWGYGNRVIDALTANGTDDTYLRQLALNNANKQDIEFGAEHLRGEGAEGLATLIQDNYEPILMHNYIVLTRPSAIGTGVNYAIYKVEVTKDEAFDIVANIANPEGYAKLPNFPVKLMYAGVCKNVNDDGDVAKTQAEIAKHVPGMAVRGVLLHRNPARISIGENAGLKKGDLVSLYSQRMTADGEEYSKRISRARVCGVWGDEAQINFEAGTAGNRKNGDIVVRTPDNKNRFGIMATWTPHVWGGQLIWDRKAGFTRSGIIHHTLVELGFSMTDHPGDKFVVLDSEHSGFEYKSPMFANIGLGYGIGKTFLGFMDVMPFFLVQYEAGIMMDLSLDDEKIAGSDTGGIIWGSAIRVPVGLRFSFNIAYPFKVVLEAGYAPYFGFGDDYEIVKATNKYLDVKRDGFFLNAGFIF